MHAYVCIFKHTYLVVHFNRGSIHVVNIGSIELDLRGIARGQAVGEGKGGREREGGRGREGDRGRQREERWREREGGKQ